MGDAQPPIGVIGVGYVGLVSAVCFAHLGHRVVCLDVDARRIAALEAGRVPIYEPGLEKLVEDNAERLAFTTSYDDLLDRCRIMFVAVDTPPSPSGDADLSRVYRVVEEVAARGGDRLLVMKSTVPVGTGEHVLRRLRSRGAEDVRYASNPEFLREGAAIQDFLGPDRIVIGASDAADGDRVEALYRGIDAPVVRTAVATAEMIKYASNAFLATKISFINEIANVCEGVGADVRTVAEGMGLDHRIGPHFLQAGIGYGGSCFPKDVQALKQLAGNSGYHFQLLNAVIEVNHLQKRRVVAKLRQRLGPLHGLKVALLGLTFKPHTDDLREAASIVLAARLIGEGATVAAYDPMVPAGEHELFPGAVICAGPLEALQDADAAVLVTEWPELVRLDWGQVRQVMRRPLVIDGRNSLDGAGLAVLGFEYEGVGSADGPVAQPLPADTGRSAPVAEPAAAAPYGESA
ncbi:MAG: UDP-glucose/GDP-mannose dehydrogenase family protein [Actinobacteria bacterium]|nr:UDP-glucose/GDP-mannose dehydrogenase family protein [Actinomycetota bacterium]